MSKITITVTVEEANLILEALGNLPFARVFNLIAAIQEQAQAQIEAQNASEASETGDEG